MAQSSDPQSHVTYHAGVSLVTHHNSDGVDQIVVPKTIGFREILIKKLNATSLAGYLGVWKLFQTLFQRV